MITYVCLDIVNDKAYKEIIVNFLKEGKKASLQDIYKEVKKNRSDLSKHWQSIVRNKLYYSKIFVKEGNEWKLK